MAVIQADKMQQPHNYCELCNKSASIYCPSDSAFLCKTCDTKVHTANFLVARHFRLPLHTKPTTHDIIASSSSSSSSSTTEESTTHPNSTDLSSSSSSSDHTRNPQPLLTHTTKTQTHNRIDIKLRNRMAIQIANWSTNLHHHNHQLLNQKSIIPVSIKLLELCLTKLPYIPIRVAAAASFWVGIRITHNRYNNNHTDAVSEVRRVEQVTDVPAKMILAVEGTLLRLLKRRKRCRRGLAGSMSTTSTAAVEFQEGWAEC